MANLVVKAKRGGQLRDYTIIIDHQPVVMVDDAGDAEVAGECGDGSRHVVVYSLFGHAGGTLSFTIECANSLVYQVDGAEIDASTEPHGAGFGHFTI